MLGVVVIAVVVAALVSGAVVAIGHRVAAARAESPLDDENLAGASARAHGAASTPAAGAASAIDGAPSAAAGTASASHGGGSVDGGGPSEPAAPATGAGDLAARLGADGGRPSAAPGAYPGGADGNGAVANAPPAPGSGPTRTAGSPPPGPAEPAPAAGAQDGGGHPPAAAAPAWAGAGSREDVEAELRERRAELGRLEERLLGKEQALDARLAKLDRSRRSVEDRARNLDRTAEELKVARQEHRRELERIAGLSASQAKQVLMRELEDELQHDSARRIRQVEEDTRREADRRARNILSTSMQRLAGGHASETTVSVVHLQSDDMKGRVIGREGRNIRALETLTGIDFIIDDTPSAVILSGFDGVRREVARLTLEKLLEDGRIHPARIEDAYLQARSELDERIVEVGEQAVFEANAGTIHPELVKLLGRLQYRTSYGQNVLAHSVECAKLAALIAAELGANPKTARRAALMHDVGKAVTHEIEGPHALVGGELARRYGEPEAIAHAMEAHHNEVEMQTVEAVVVQVADALSGARPGARGESLEQYVKRLRDLEAIATRHAGVEKVYAMQAGREVRVIVRPEDVDDDTASLLSRQIARDVERELEYPGQIKVTVIRESRAVDYAK